MKCAICAIAKNEHRYINDWCCYYANLGFDDIYIYDNDDENAPFIGDFIEDSVRDKVHIINIRGQHYKQIQIMKYKEFYKKQRKNYDWIFFPDIDEFLTGLTNIKDFLAQEKFNDIHSIRFKWRLIGDDNLIERDMSKPIYECLFKCVEELEFEKGYNNVEIFFHKNQGKFMIRGKLPFSVAINSEHYAGKGSKEKKLKAVLPSGKPCNSEIIIRESYKEETVFLNHYMTKTLSEFIAQKMGRTDAIFEDRILGLGYYWRINKITTEKLDWLRNRGIMTQAEIDWAYGVAIE